MCASHVFFLLLGTQERELRRKLGQRRGAVTCWWSSLCIEELHNLYASVYISRMMKSVRYSCIALWPVEVCGEFLVWKVKRKRQLNEVDMDGKGVLLTCHPDTWGVDVLALLILKFGARWGWAASAVPQLLHPKEGALVPIVQNAGWASGPVWMCGEKRVHLATTGVWRSNCPACSSECCTLYAILAPRHRLEGNINMDLRDIFALACRLIPLARDTN